MIHEERKATTRALRHATQHRKQWGTCGETDKFFVKMHGRIVWDYLLLYYCTERRTLPFSASSAREAGQPPRVAIKLWGGSMRLRSRKVANRVARCAR